MIDAGGRGKDVAFGVGTFRMTSFKAAYVPTGIRSSDRGPIFRSPRQHGSEGKFEMKPSIVFHIIFCRLFLAMVLYSSRLSI
jgi:hypothetical protein